jgi:hypothetical protein
LNFLGQIEFLGPMEFLCLREFLGPMEFLCQIEFLGLREFLDLSEIIGLFIKIDFDWIIFEYHEKFKFWAIYFILIRVVNFFIIVLGYLLDSLLKIFRKWYLFVCRWFYTFRIIREFDWENNKIFVFREINIRAKGAL